MQFSDQLLVVVVEGEFVVKPQTQIAEFFFGFGESDTARLAFADYQAVILCIVDEVVELFLHEVGHASNTQWLRPEDRVIGEAAHSDKPRAS